MSAHDAEAMANAMLLDSPLLDPERANEEIPEDGGSSKLPGGGEGEKLLAFSFSWKLAASTILRDVLIGPLRIEQ